MPFENPMAIFETVVIGIPMGISSRLSAVKQIYLELLAAVMT